MRDPELLAAYRATTWTLELPEGRRALRLTEPPPGIPRPLGIITAYNPASEPRCERVNRAANEELRRALETAGATVFPTVAGGTGKEAEKWTEPGFAVLGLARETLVALGERYGQNAIVWVDDAGRATLVVTRPGFCGGAVGKEIGYGSAAPGSRSAR